MVLLAREPKWLELKRGGFNTSDILRHFEISIPPVDVRALATAMEIHVHDVPNPGWAGAVSSSIERADVWLRAEDAEMRKRFTLAHEIGHLMLHELGEQHRDVTFSGTEAEAQANGFAAHLLMPLWMLQSWAGLYDFNVQVLADGFQVSPTAMQIQLLRLSGMK